MTNFLNLNVVRIAILALVYFAAAKMGLVFALVGHTVTLFWAPSGIALACLLLFGRRVWPGIFIGAFLINLHVYLPISAAIGIAAGSTVGALCGAYLLKRKSAFNPNLVSVQDVLRLLIFGALISTAINAANGALWLAWTGDVIPWYLYGQTFMYWWMGDALGVVLFTPAVMALYRTSTMEWTPYLRRMALLMYGVLIVLCLLVLTDMGKNLLGYQLKAFALFPIIIWAALAFDLRVASLALVTIYSFLLFGLINGIGRFANAAQTDAFDVWMFSSVIGIGGVCVAIMHEQRLREVKNLELSERNFKRAQQVVNMGSWQIDIRSDTLTVSDEVIAIFGLKHHIQDINRKNFLNCAHPDDRWIMDAGCKGALHGEVCDIEFRIVVHEQIKWVRETIDVDFDQIGQPIVAFGTIRDITRRKLTEENLRLAANVFEGSSEAILIADSEERIVSVNQAFTKATGYTLDEVKGKNPSILSSGQHDAEFYRVMWADINRDGFWQGEILERDKGGRIYPKWMSISTVKNESGVVTHYISISADISERKNAERDIQSLAYYDVLTRLPNRTLLHDRLGQLIATSHRDQHQFALLFLDLDRFKYVNDSMGHTVGDKLLQAVALRLQECVREGDTVARIGGDEFVVLLRETDADDAARVATKILLILATPYDIGDLQIATHASIGISIYPDNAHDIDTLIKYADVAMYRVKEEGRSNFQFYAPEMNFHADKLFSMEKDLRIALERNEFILHYQPQINLRYGRICGVEALIRWQHPEIGLITPSEFIPVAEETGQILPIGEWVLRTACEQLARWRKQGLPIFPIAVNLSTRQLRQPNLAKLVATVLAETGLGAHDLELEITEGLMMGETEAAITFLNQMQELGVHLSVDDFGTGYSSLSYLKRLPLDKLKIDQSFVRDITTDENDAVIVRSIIGLGHQLNLQVIAEGVETVEQMNFLRSRGCDEIQGYYFSYPLPSDELAVFVKNHPVIV